MPLNDSPLARALILEILHISPKPMDSSHLLRLNDCDWDYLSRIVRMHRLGPALHDGIVRKNLLPAIPSKVFNAIRQAKYRHTLRNLAACRELVTVTRLLDAAEIPSLALKGAYLANFTYAEPGLRPMRDVDLLVSKTHAIRAFDLLKANGYRPCYEGLPEAYLEGNKIHLPPLVRPNGIPVELHHRLTFPHPNGETAEYETAEYESALWARSVSKPLGNTAIGFPCAEDLVLHLCYHATAGHQFSIGPLALLDLALLIQRDRLDWGQILLMAVNGWRHYLIAPLYLAKLHLGANIPDWFMDKLDPEHDKGLWLESAEYLLFSELGDHMLLNSDMQKILCSKNPLERISAFNKIVFPTRATIATHFPIRPDSPIAFLYYPRHWQRLVKKKLPSLLANLMEQPRAIEKLASHKRTFSRWLGSGTGDKTAQ
jgi:hypothetical protein